TWATVSILHACGYSRPCIRGQIALRMHLGLLVALLFFFNNPPPTEIYTLSLHDALPISSAPTGARRPDRPSVRPAGPPGAAARADRKSTRLNSSHDQISYAVFCLKKKKNVSRQ